MLINFNMDRYKIIWRAIQKYGYKYDLREISSAKKTDYINVICDKHGKFLISREQFLSRRSKGCKLCFSESRRITKEKFLEKFNEKYKDKFIILSDIENITHKTKLKIQCNNCGKIFEPTINNLLKKGGIKCCDSTFNRLTIDEIQRRIDKIYNGQYKIVSDKTISIFKRIKLICDKHGEFEQTPTALFKGHGCQLCGKEIYHKSRILSHDEFVKRAEKIHGKNSIIYLNEYNGGNNPIMMKCLRCGKITVIKSAANHLYEGAGCKFCNSSSLERKMRVSLDANNISFIQQYRVQRQFLDFYLQEYNIGIECQGSQHFKEKFNFKGKDAKSYSLEETINRDIKKYNYCRYNGIMLLYLIEQKYINTIEPLKEEKYKGIYDEINCFFDVDEIVSYIKKQTKILKVI